VHHQTVRHSENNERAVYCNMSELNSLPTCRRGKPVTPKTSKVLPNYTTSHLRRQQYFAQSPPSQTRDLTKRIYMKMLTDTHIQVHMSMDTDIQAAA